MPHIQHDTKQYSSYFNESSYKFHTHECHFQQELGLIEYLVRTAIRLNIQHFFSIEIQL